MRLRNMLKICLVSWKSEPHYAYKRYAYKRKTCMMVMMSISDLKSESVLFYLVLKGK